MKPFWQYWLEVIGIGILILMIIGIIFGVVVLLNLWFGDTVTIIIMGFLIVTLIIAFNWWITDDDYEHSQRW